MAHSFKLWKSIFEEALTMASWAISSSRLSQFRTKTSFVKIAVLEKNYPSNRSVTLWRFTGMPWVVEMIILLFGRLLGASLVITVMPLSEAFALGALGGLVVAARGPLLKGPGTLNISSKDKKGRCYK